jgi:hypothetical protein
MPAAPAAMAAAQLHFEVDEPHGVGPPAGQTRMVNHRPVPAAGALPDPLFVFRAL